MALPFRSIFGLSETGTPAPGATVHRVDGKSLQAAIPEALRSATVWSADTVELELDGASVVTATGELVTRLGAVYRACPQFFSRPVDESSDQEVILRMSGAVSAGAGNPFGPANPFVSPLVSPIGLAAENPGAAEGAPVTSPFSVVAPSGGEANPFAAAAGGGAEVSKPPLSPFLAAITGQAPAAPAEAAEPAKAPVGPPPLPGGAKAPETGQGGGEMLVFSLKAVLSGMEASRLGIHPGALPEGWKTKLPLSLVEPQLAGGRVVVTVARLLEGADAAARIGLQGVPADLEVDLPLKEVYRQLPAEAPAPETASVPGGFSGSPFLEQAREESKRGFVPLKEAPPARLDPTMPGTNPFTGAAGGFGKVPKPAPVIPADAPVESLDDLVPAKAPEVTEPVATGEPVAAVEAAPVPEATARPAAVPAAVPADVEPVRPVIGKTQPAAPVPGAGGGSGAGAERGWLRFDGVGFQPAARDLELRAVFGRSEPFTRQLAMELTAAMPGVRGCVLFAADSLEVLASAWPGEAEARALAERTPKMFGRIEGLAEDLGLESGETFTLRTSQGIVSFFRSGGRCLSVLHADAPMEGGVWERLVLVARGAAALES